MSLVLDNISLRRSDNFALNVSAEFKRPITGVLGPSGAGKTTLLEMIAGLQQPEQGRIVLGGKTLTACEEHFSLKPELRRIGYVPQDLALFPHLNVRQNLLYGCRHNSSTSLFAKIVQGEQPVAQIAELLQIDHLLSRSTSQLSGGEKQRVALGRALLSDPELLLLDEPLSSLDDTLKKHILPYFSMIVDTFGIPIIYVTHARIELEALDAEIWHMADGRMLLTSVQEGSA